MDKKQLTTFGFVFARGGSKGVPKKNIRDLSGKPLIAYSIETGRASRFIDDIFVSTDDAEIASVAKSCGAQVPFMRPGHLASDDSPEWLSWQHAVKKLQAAGRLFDVFVSISATSPLRTAEDIDNCILALLGDKEADAAITVTPAKRHPAFNMVVLDQDFRARIAVPKSNKVFRRQDAADMYDVTTVAYAARPEYILNASSLFEGRVVAAFVPEERALDIDTEFDLRVAELLLRNR